MLHIQTILFNLDQVPEKSYPYFTVNLHSTEETKWKTGLVHLEVGHLEFKKKENLKKEGYY